jgi:hypothetical protein
MLEQLLPHAPKPHLAARVLLPAAGGPYRLCHDVARHGTEHGQNTKDKCCALGLHRQQVPRCVPVSSARSAEADAPAKKTAEQKPPCANAGHKGRHRQTQIMCHMQCPIQTLQKKLCRTHNRQITSTTRWRCAGQPCNLSYPMSQPDIQQPTRPSAMLALYATMAVTAFRRAPHCTSSGKPADATSPAAANHLRCCCCH